MENKKRTILIFFLVAILLLVFYLQSSLITKFSLLPERLELVFNESSEILPLLLGEEEYTILHDTYNENSFIIIEKPMDLDDEFFRDRFIDYLRSKIPEINGKDLDMRDYSLSKNILIQWNKASKLFIGILAFILIVISLVRRVKANYIKLKTKLDIYYLKEIVNLKTSEILEEAIKLVLVMFGGIFLLQWIIDFQFNIPGRYLPAKDIFDFKFYKSLNNSIEINLSNYGQYYYSSLSKVKLLTMGISFLAFCIFILIIKMKSNVINGEGDKYGKSNLQ